MDEQMINMALDEMRMSQHSSELARKPSAASIAEITAIVLDVEKAKQVKNLNDAHRIILVNELYKLGETVSQLQKRGASVVLAETYGTIAFRYWVLDLIALKSDVDRSMARLARIEKDRRARFEEEVECAVDRRIARFKEAQSPSASASDDKIAELVGEEAAVNALIKRRETLTVEARRRATLRLKRAKGQLAAMDTDSRKKVLDIAVERGIIESYDQSMIDHIHFFADKFYKITETT